MKLDKVKVITTEENKFRKPGTVIELMPHMAAHFVKKGLAVYENESEGKTDTESNKEQEPKTKKSKTKK